jgi:acyl-CoA synthetase (AMP-forming)/AMP-acid ligase II
VTQAGGRLHDAFIQEFITAFPNVRFYVMYGQTEATARLSWLPPEKLSEKIGSCGIGVPGVNLKVVDETGSLVKTGEVGEIIASGENIMLGYYMDPDSTSQILKDGWLYTGDLAVMDEDGYLYLKARKKEIIKVGGRRISPKEVEEVIVSMPEVIDCEIIKVSDDLLGETMKALITIKEAARDKIHPGDVKKYCAGKLSTYKIPQIIEFQFNLTISATGKKIKKNHVN